jgi:2-polyprenyl-3-methyl-5-hydroxy-6-metoxy-1,4-benzoquinol methylase
MEPVTRYIGEHWLSARIDPYDDPWYRFARILEAIDETFAVPEGAKWLDLGCHQGQFVHVVQAKYRVVGTGVDDWPASLSSDRSWRYLQGNVAALALDEQFQFVSALEVLEHMVDTDAFLRLCNRRLDSGGRLVLSTPNINSLRNRLTVPFGAYPAGLEYRNVIHHVRLYNVELLSRHLAEHGFEVDCVRGVAFAPMHMIRRELAPPLLERAAANRLAHLCGNVIVLARKVRDDHAATA